MRKTVPLVFTLVLLMGVCIWAGCSVGSGGAIGTEEGTEKGTEGEKATPAWMAKYPNAPTSIEDLGVPQYPPSEIDETETDVDWDTPDYKYANFVYMANQCPVANVAAFFRETLQGMKNLDDSGEGTTVDFYFETPDGVPVEIFISPQNPANPEGPSKIEFVING